MKTERPGRAPVANRRAEPAHTVHGLGGRTARRRLIELATSVAVAIVGMYLLLD